MQEITGTVTVRREVSPNSWIPPSVEWQTNDPLGGEIRVSSADGEKVVTRGTKGSTPLHWVRPDRSYSLLLYSLTEPKRKLASVDLAAQDPGSAVAPKWGVTDREVREIVEQVAAVVPKGIYGGRYAEFFRLCEAKGFHITPANFYQPIPNLRTLDEQTWDRASQLPGLEMNEENQLDLLRTSFPAYSREYTPTQSSGVPPKFYFGNCAFDGTDALSTYCMIRHFKPGTVIEVGSGYSSLVSAEALQRNERGKLICIEPFPRDFVQKGFPGLDTLIQKKVEEVEIDFFLQLGQNDILFIDSSHTVKIGSDVNYLVLEILPRLRPGVIVHFHDIFLPYDYPRDWVVNEMRFWNEQYLLQAFLAFNTEFRVLLANNYLARNHLEVFKRFFSNSPWWGGSSFWIQRCFAAEESACFTG
jgi:hypothetical protein